MIQRPLPGTSGQIGNTALFAGESKIAIPAASPVNALTNNLTIMAWVNPITVDGKRRILMVGHDNSVNGQSIVRNEWPLIGVTTDTRFVAVGSTNSSGGRTAFSTTYARLNNRSNQRYVPFQRLRDGHSPLAF